MGLRPVGEPVARPQRRAKKPIWSGDYRAVYLRSGTEALALALIMIRSATDIPKPAVILPAYGCPDIVSAASYAGFRVILADLDEDSPFMDASALDGLLRDDAVAIVAAHFLGIPEHLGSIGRVCEDRGVFIVEDSAQLFPDIRQDAPTEDLVVLSFGRGKPVSALGGGALLFKNSWSPDHHLVIGNPVRQNPLIAGLRLKLRRLFYNFLIHEIPYTLLRGIPKTGLGETRYRRLNGIAEAGSALRRQIWTAIDRHPLKISTAQNAIHNRLMHGIGDVTDLAGPLAASSRLVRYPILLPDQKTRDEIRLRLERSGLGSSVMYGVPLPAIRDIAGDLNGDNVTEFPRATNFAERLLTLPVHSGVKLSDVDLMLDIIYEGLN